MNVLPVNLPIRRACDLEPQSEDQSWLIQSFWSRAGVGIIGGAPKCCKSWLGLDMAVSVASGTPCLDRFAVATRGPVLIYLAEDAAGSIRNRLDALCRHRGLDLTALPLFVIVAPVLRLDLTAHQSALQAALAEYKPKLLLLDPLVRLHRLDENSAAEVSGLLGFLRECQRTFRCAIVLVHHASKKQRAQPGQSLRGSSDLHAFGDSNAYLARHKHRLILTLEHRSAKPPDPFMVELATPEDGSTHLTIPEGLKDMPDLELPERILALLRQASRPLSRTEIRAQLRVQNQRLGEALTALATAGAIHQHISKGWLIGRNDQPARMNA